MWVALLEFLAPLGLRLLGTLFQTLVSKATEYGIDAACLDNLSALVDSAENNTVLDTPEKKYNWVKTEAWTYFKDHQIQCEECLLNALIELAVHHLHHSSP